MDYTHNGKRIITWTDDIEDGALKQIVNLAEHPCTYDRVCIMPDCHEGYGMPIGGVIACKDAVIPNAVGVDIGCSMTAVKTNIKICDVSKNLLKGAIDLIKDFVPVGFNHRDFPAAKAYGLFGMKIPYIESLMQQRYYVDKMKIVSQEKESALYQIGTLGGGNHFIELQSDGDSLWYMIHTGSRNLGKKVCEYYNEEAKCLCSKFRQNDVVNNELSFIPKGIDLYEDYIKEMNFCRAFSKLNHEVISSEVSNILWFVFMNDVDIVEKESYFTEHNYASMENISGKNLIIHRKGAVCARKNSIAIIPGSQGTSSYICKGKGNELSFFSASHGAGRKMSRKKAKETLDLEEVKIRMDKKGILHNLVSVDQLDEADEAYKNIEDVIRMESDLVSPIVKLNPIAVIKG